MLYKAFLINKTTSTMDLAKQIAKNHDDTDIFFSISTKEQTNGRGRNANIWHQATLKSLNYENNTIVELNSLSQIHNDVADFLPTTFAFNVKNIKIPLEWLSLAMGAVVYDAIKKCEMFFNNVLFNFKKKVNHNYSSIYLKWPNDIIVYKNGEVKKIVGILCEHEYFSNDYSVIYVGVGINFFNKPNIDIADTVFNILSTNLQTNKKHNRLLKTTLKNKNFKINLIKKFAEFLEDEIKDYFFTARSKGQLKNIILERSLPIGTMLSVNKNEIIGKFHDINLNAELEIFNNKTSIISGDVQIYKNENTIKNIDLNIKKELKTIYVENKNILLCEIGNTRLHWTFFKLNKKLEENIINNPLNLSLIDKENYFYDDIVCNDLINNTNKTEIKKICLTINDNSSSEEIVIVYTSVNSNEYTQKIIQLLENGIKNNIPKFKLKVHAYTSYSIMQIYGLENLYDTKLLGTDRALRFIFGYLFAKKSQTNILIASVGTAFTVECVNKNGEIIDSLISSGIQMQLNALHNYTAKLPQLEINDNNYSLIMNKFNQFLPNQTEYSMLNGIIINIFSTLLFLIEKYAIKNVFLSGGNSEYIYEIIKKYEQKYKFNICTAKYLENILLLHVYLKNNIIKSNIYNNNENENIDIIDQEYDERLDEIVSSLNKPRTSNLTIQPRTNKYGFDDFRRLGVRIEKYEIKSRLDKFLVQKYKFHTRDIWKKRIANQEIAIENNAILVNKDNRVDDFFFNDKVHQNKLIYVKSTYRLKMFDQIWLYHPRTHEPEVINTCKVIADDNDIVVFSKPANLVIHAVGQYSQNTFLNIAQKMSYSNASPVHRIDRETSGILVCARNSSTRHQISLAFKNGLVQKMYIAICKKEKDLPSKFKVTLPIGDAINSKIRLKLWVGGQNPMNAETLFYKLAETDDYYLFACFPKTGRTNQIRIHLAAVGAWIIGDKMYHPNEDIFIDFYDHGLNEKIMKATLFPRHMLHNTVIAINHFSNNNLLHDAVICPIPEDFYAFSDTQKLLKKANISFDETKQKAELKEIFYKGLSENIDNFINIY